MQKIKILLSLIFFINTLTLFAQADSVLDFWPVHKGDVWQYREGSTNNVDHTVYIDSVTVDSLSKELIIYHRAGYRYRIDSLGNLYNMDYNPEYVRYNLYADSGDSWIAGISPDTVTVRIFTVFNSVVFGESSVVKGFRFERHLSEPPYLITLGDDYLAKGFGLIRTESEGFLFYLSGAIIDGKKYGVVTSTEKETQVSESFDIITNYPNPFNNSTIISYTIANEGDVNISVFDVLGRKVKDLIDEKKEKGSYKIRLNADELSSGIYFLVLNTNSSILTHKICLLK
ncbi:MAG: T9SS type A sorting domain-containing protein [Ignavibacteriaceae bacterium]